MGWLKLTGISRESVLIAEHQLAAPASMDALMSLRSLSAAISSFQANSTSHLANYSERAAGFLGLQVSHSLCFLGITLISLCQDHSGLVHPLTPNHLTWQLANNFPYHTALLIKLLWQNDEGWCLVP